MLELAYILKFKMAAVRHFENKNSSFFFFWISSFEIFTYIFNKKVCRQTKRQQLHCLTKYKTVARPLLRNLIVNLFINLNCKKMVLRNRFFRPKLLILAQKWSENEFKVNLALYKFVWGSGLFCPNLPTLSAQIDKWISVPC